MDLSFFQDGYVWRIVVALVLGVLIGTERQYSHHMAGVRTNALVSAGACLYVLFSMLLGEGDPQRVAGQVVTGIGFLGGGVIVRDGFTIKGLTTAATLWCTASVGVLAGAGYMLAALAAAVLVVLVNIALRPYSEWIGRLKPTVGHPFYRLVVDCQPHESDRLKVTVGRLTALSKLQMMGLEMNNEYAQGMDRWFLTLQAEGDRDGEVEQLLATILSEPGVTGGSWMPLNRQEDAG